MATEAKLRQLADRGCPVYYFYSSERYLVRQAVSAAVRILSADTDEETTVLDGTEQMEPVAHNNAGTGGLPRPRRAQARTQAEQNGGCPA